MSAPKIAIVTTLRDAGLVLDSFIQYHLAIGFDHLFLFFDEPNDPSLDRARQYEAVTAIENDDSLRRQWEASRLFALDSGLRRFVDKEVMGRQELNAGLAVQMAVEKKIDWLLHIDSTSCSTRQHKRRRNTSMAFLVEQCSRLPMRTTRQSPSEPM